MRAFFVVFVELTEKTDRQGPKKDQKIGATKKPGKKERKVFGTTKKPLVSDA